MPDGQTTTCTFAMKRGISKTTEYSLEVTNSVGGSIEGIFDFSIEVKSRVTESTTTYSEYTESYTQEVKGPADRWRYQQVVLYATAIANEPRNAEFLTKGEVEYVEKDGSLMFITLAYHNATDNSHNTKARQVKSGYEDHEFIDYLLGPGFNKWSAQPMSKLEGDLVKAEGNDTVYLVLDKKIRHISNYDVFLAVFDPKAKIKTFPKVLVERMPQAEELGSGTEMISTKDGTFLLHNGIMRPISGDAMRKYGFNTTRVRAISGDGTEEYSLGPNIG